MGDMVTWFCERHVHEPFLVEYVTEQIRWLDEDSGECELCLWEARPGMPMDDLVELVEQVVDRHFERAADNGVPWDSEEGGWAFSTSDTEEVLQELGLPDAVDAEIMNTLVASIEDDSWVDRGSPARSPIERLGSGWRTFVRHVQHTSRFLLRPEPERPHDIFFEDDRDVPVSEVMHAIGQLIVSPQLDILTTVDTATAIYRARAYGEVRPREPLELVAPPPPRATAGRMNAAGIPVLYGAFDAETAAAEVYDGSDNAVIACLHPVRDLTVVDLTQVPRFSIFDLRVSAEAFERAAFLNGFVNDVVRPVVRDGRRDHEYAPTQYVTEYLRWQLGHGQLRVDGVVFRSARRPGGRNIVVFTDGPGCLTDEQLGRPRPSWIAAPLLALADAVEIREYGPPTTRVVRQFSVADRDAPPGSS